MNVGLLIYGSLETLSGGYLYDRQLVNYLRTAGHDVNIISLPWRNYPLHLTQNFNSSIMAHIAAASYDVLLQDELNHPSLFWLNKKLKKQISCPVISIVHHLRSLEGHGAGVNWFYRLVEKRYLATVDGFIFNSETTRQTVNSLIKHELPHVVAYPAGDRFEPIRQEMSHLHNPPPGHFNILFVGNIIPRKQLHILIAAVERLPFKNWSLDVVGDLKSDPFYALEILRIAEKKRLQNHIRFLGQLDDDALALRFSASNILVVPSRYEGFGIVYLEGMGFGLPAIGTTAGAAGEIITHGQNGFLIHPEDEVTLANLLVELYENPAQLAKMSCAASQRFDIHPTWEESCLKIEQFLLEISN